MARILITSGPTREYLDPVRYLSNASSGRMGCALAEAAVRAGHEACVVTGPVEVSYPDAAQVVRVVSTEEMLQRCLELFPRCDGLIAVAAPCDYRPEAVSTQKLSKSGDGLTLRLVETPDIVAALGRIRREQWMVAFALETRDRHVRAMQKLERKNCDLIVLNGPEAMHAAATSVEMLDRAGAVVASLSGSKTEVARGILEVVTGRLMGARG